MQRQVPARSPARAGESLASADAQGGSGNAAFSAILSGKERNAAANRDKIVDEDRPDNAVDADTIDPGTFDMGEDLISPESAQSSEMLSLLSDLMSSAAFTENTGPAAELGGTAAPEQETPSPELPAADIDAGEAESVPLANQSMDPATAAPVEPDTAVAALLENQGGKPGHQDQPAPVLVEPGDSAPAQTPAPAPQTAAMAAQVDSRVNNLSPNATNIVATPAAGARTGQAGPTPAKTASSDAAPERQKKSAANTEALGALARTSPTPPATTAENSSVPTDGFSRPAGRMSAGVDRQPDERIEAKPRTVEVVESRRFMPVTPLSDNAQLLTGSLIEAGDSALAAQRAAPAGSAAAAGAAQTGQTLHTLKLQLNPVSMGSVTAVLKLSGETLSVEIKVETADAYRQLSDDSQSILKALRGQGYGVEQISIQHVPTPDRSASQTAQPGYQGSFQGSEAGDPRTSSGGNGRNNASGQDQQGRQANERNANAGSGTGRSDGVYL